MVAARGASVSLDGPSDAFQLVEVEPGHYACECAIVPGGRYTVTVLTQDDELAVGITHVPLPPQISPSSGSVDSRQTLVELSWPSVTHPGRYGIYHRTPPNRVEAAFLLYVADTAFSLQPLGYCDAQCCDGAELLVAAFSPSVLTERGFPAPPGSSDTLNGSVGFVGAVTSDSAAFHLANSGPC
jgi:hypothetical protein